MTVHKGAIQVQFQPTGKRVEVPPGTDLLEAARQAGIELTAACGGEGSCGQCQVIVLSGRVSAPSPDETLTLSQADLRSGRRLACQTHALPGSAPLVVDVPTGSVLTGQRLQTETTLLAASPAFPLEPSVRACALELERPTLADPRGDLARVVDGLRAAYDLPPLRASTDVIRQLPALLREHSWRITAFVRDDMLLGAAGPGARPYGLCVDLGTTKMAALLVDLLTGETLAEAGAPNPQVGYGEDVISRLSYAQRHPQGADILADKVQAGLDNLLGELTDLAGVPRSQVVEACLVGNTVMLHLLLRLPTRQLSLAPYVPAASEAIEVPARELGLDMAPGALVYLPPGVGGFIGADHVAMILACGLDRSDKVSLGVDIGTNTEIILRRPGMPFLASASCASGPAFEGAHIAEGMRAASGAIERVRLSPTRVDLSTIQGAPPVGLCGSGIVDAVGELHRLGLITRQGMLLVDGTPYLRRGRNGSEFVLVPAARSGSGHDIVLDQKDINEVQLAKGAIHAGLMILMSETGTPPEMVEEVIVAGAFGAYLNIDHAVAIGLFPRLPNARFIQVGNAALAGARALLLSREARQRAEALRGAARYQELTNYPRFSRMFAQGMIFPELEDEP